jgi:hypothetical protein
MSVRACASGSTPLASYERLRSVAVGRSMLPTTCSMNFEAAAVLQHDRGADLFLFQRRINRCGHAIASDTMVAFFALASLKCRRPRNRRRWRARGGEVTAAARVVAGVFFPVKPAPADGRGRCDRWRLR